MDLYPAIDLLDGQCVRLKYGDYSQKTRYGVDPVVAARSFAGSGASWIHVVDLNAARGDGPVNRDVIKTIAASVDCDVQVGGGIRDETAAKTLLDAGVTRVVVGTAAVRNPDLVETLSARGGCVAVGLDVRDGEVAVNGWHESSGLSLDQMLASFANVGVAAFVVTFIERDGTLEGPDVDGYADVLANTSADVIASGGVGNAGHIAELAAIRVSGRRLSGAIAGKALHDGLLTVEAAIEAASCA